MCVRDFEEGRSRERREVYFGKFWERWVSVWRGDGDERRRRMDFGPRAWISSGESGEWRGGAVLF